MASAGQRCATKPRSLRQSILRTAVPAVGVVAVIGAGAAAVVQSPPSVAPASVAAQADVLSAVEPPTTDVSRSGERPPLPNEAVAEAEVEGRLYATQDLAVHADSSTSSPRLASVKRGDTVEVTGKTVGGFTQIIHNDVPRWVATRLVSKNEPLGTTPCPFGSEAGLQPDSVKAMRAICEKFPQITTIGTIAGRGEHATGHSIDIMISTDLGNEIAAFLQKHQSELGISYLIWRQQIWRPATSSSWRYMSDRGSATANHMDHVHVTTFGNAATS